MVTKSPNYDELARNATDTLAGPRPGQPEIDARLQLWRAQEWHNWFRWCVCTRGFDWSKPVWIALLVIGFGGLVVYGSVTDKWFVTAGGVVLWFTLVNLAFFGYFGPRTTSPRPMPGPFSAGLLVRAEMGLFPPGYEWRKLARILLRVKTLDGSAIVIELALPKLSADLEEQLQRQTLSRLHCAGAPKMTAIVETLPVSRPEIDAGAAPVRIVAWSWDEEKTEIF